ncbi:hypothetical protein ACIBL8_47915 [Streptomyces sp. NPDC050523]|uniref:hypothetical protein n=1 Tax=Streptomyces sp. NPDC050523 TaxID=3365622 RepID=UPI00379D4565
MAGDLAVKGRKTSSRREYVQIFKGFHRFLQARKSAEIDAAFGVRLVCPLDEINASRHVGDDSQALAVPPTPLLGVNYYSACGPMPGRACGRLFAMLGSPSRMGPSLPWAGVSTPMDCSPC